MALQLPTGWSLPESRTDRQALGSVVEQRRPVGAQARRLERETPPFFLLGHVPCLCLLPSLLASLPLSLNSFLPPSLFSSLPSSHLPPSLPNPFLFYSSELSLLRTGMNIALHHDAVQLGRAVPGGAHAREVVAASVRRERM